MGSLAALVLGGLGVLFIGSGTWLGRSHRRSLDRSERVRLRVVGLDERVADRDDDDPRLTWAPIYEVMDGRHRGETATDAMASHPAAHAIGDEVDGLRDPADGSLHSTRTARSAQYLAAVFIVLGFAAFLGGLYAGRG